MASNASRRDRIYLAVVLLAGMLATALQFSKVNQQIDKAKAARKTSVANVKETVGSLEQRVEALEAGAEQK